MLHNVTHTDNKFYSSILPKVGFYLMLLLVLSNCQTDKGKNLPPTQLKHPSLTTGRYNVAFLITNGVFNTELTAPWDIFQHTIFRDSIKAMNVFLVSNQNSAVRTFEGLRILPDYNFLQDSLPHIDILVIPSAEHHLDTDLENQALINWVRKTGQNAQYVTSHCDGAFILAQAGLLDHVASTTFPGDIDKYKKRFPQLDIRKDVTFVHDKKFITSAGGARSFDGALYLCELLYGKKIAQRLAKGLVLDWDLANVKKVIVNER